MMLTSLTGLSDAPESKLRYKTTEWTEKLGMLDTEQYPWQTALLTELIKPFDTGATVKVVGFDGNMSEDVAVIRQLFPWEETDDESATVVKSYHDNRLDFVLTRMIKLDCFEMEAFTYDVKTPKGVTHHARMMSIDNYMRCLKYFFDKGHFNDR